MKGILVGVNTTDLELEELQGIAEACSIEVCHTITQNLEKINPAHYVGKGKLEEIKMALDFYKAEVVIFNNELSPSQYVNIEDHLKCIVYDKTYCILEIFNQRAQTKEAKIQTEIATLNYMLPRLIAVNKNLSRQVGSGGGLYLRGGGETVQELKRRNVRQRLSDLNKTLKEIKKTNETKKTKRNKSFLKQVALVGYTNSGKSTTLNLFLEDEEKLVITKDMLFTTLDTYTRIVDINHHKILLSDTVGFISDLPKQLVDAFLSTIIEVKEADLIIQVVNGSNPNFEEEIENTNKILKQIGANQIKKIYLINKVDLVEHALIIPSKYENVIKFSAKTKENFNHLVDAIEDKLFSNEYFIKVEIPLEESKLINDLKKQGQVIKIVYNQTAVYLEVLVNKQLFDQIIKYKK